MKEKIYSKDIVHAINTYLKEDDWNFSFDEMRGVFKFGLSLKAKMKKINYFIYVKEDEYIVYAVSSLGADEEDEKMMATMAEFVCRAIFREKQISVTLLLQSESQLESMYGSDDATTIINNCDTYLYMGGMDLKTGRSISERLNIPLDEVLYMPIGQVCIFRRGQRPIITSRYDILENEQYQQITKQYEDSIREHEH